VSTERERQFDESNSPTPVKSSSSGEQALQRLIRGALPQGELASLIEAIFSSKKAIDMVGCLQEREAQTFIDVVHEVRCHFLFSRNGPSDVVANPPKS